ncbi:MAG: VOC family protein [Bacteroidetes bacterium]|nr:VOC family protein [Bacteroidota bacterium]
MLEFHHVGCIVESIDASVALHLESNGGKISEKFHITSQKVTVCFAELAPGIHIEFVQADETGSVIDGLKKKHTTYYHLGYKVADFDKAVAQLESTDHKVLSIFSSEAFLGKRCAFLFTPDMRLIELIEK